VNVGVDNSNPVIVKLDSVKAVGCADTLSGAVYVSVSGGTTPYSYMWSTGAVTQDLMNVKVGTYSLNVTDDAGCSDDLSATVGKATQITVNADVDMVNCYGGNDGSITVKINGGSGNYRYEWTDGNASGTRTGLVAGSYTVTVTDNASGCTGKDTFTVTQSDSLLVSAVVVKDSCLPGFDGKISLLVNGGTKPYTYNWSNGDQTDLIQNLAPQDYTVTITDAGGCKATMTYAVAAADCDFTLTIYDVITPNGDGKNDIWVIGGIEFYPNSVLQVVDKWGDIVYEKKGYDNSFTGISSRNNQELPSGTYYYVLKLNGANKTGGKNTFTGSLLIER
jgi:gliding motility-associated-like protein